MSKHMPFPVNFKYCLAPMVGLSHVSMRRVIADYLPSELQTIWPSEMLNSRRIPGEALGVVPETKKRIEETFWVPQILGNEEEPIAQSVKKLEAFGAHGIDINMGCPVRKALKHNYGVALMGDKDYAASVVKMTSENTRLPVSVKLRAPDEGHADDFLPFVEGLIKNGAQYITFHPRTPEQKRRGSADWSQIKDLNDRLTVPVIGNGDVQTASDAQAMLEQTGCSMVMIGRALVARPWMFWQLAETELQKSLSNRSGAPTTEYEEGEEAGRALLSLARYMAEDFKDQYALRKFNFFMRTSSVWLEFGHALMARVSNCPDMSAVQEELTQFFVSPQKMYQRSDLRY